MGIEEWIAAKKRESRIKNMGFSYHGGSEAFVACVDAWPWDFCMIQYNYLDEYNQAGKKGLLYAASKGLPVIVMEPLRGGQLVNGLPKEALRRFETLPVKRGPAEWGLRWVWNHPEVTIALSGVGNESIAMENIRATDGALPDTLSEEELACIAEVKDLILSKTVVPCTGCGYCLPCPMGVDIPTCFSCTNAVALDGWLRSAKNYLMQTGFRAQTGNASRCSQCGQCEAKCPQSVPIRQALAQTVKKLEGFYYKPASFVIRKAYRIK